MKRRAAFFSRTRSIVHFGSSTQLDLGRTLLRAGSYTGVKNAGKRGKRLLNREGSVSDAVQCELSSITSPSGAERKQDMPSPKLNLGFGPWSNTEYHMEVGFGFHSNDARGTTQTVERVSGKHPHPNTPATRIWLQQSASCLAVSSDSG